VDRVGQAFTRSGKKSIARASAELQMPQTTVLRILQKCLLLKPYKSQAVQKLTTRDKQLRLQFTELICGTNFGT
jgi:hypothetical protein